MRLVPLFLLFGSAAFPAVFAAPEPAAAAARSPDLGNGTLKHPVLHADYCDPAVMRVGDDYCLAASSFNHVPGLPILHSRGPVNWTLVNHALRAQMPADHFAVPRHGARVWAPAIRHHAGKYWIYCPDSDLGIYVITAADPRGAKVGLFSGAPTPAGAATFDYFRLTP